MNKENLVNQKPLCKNQFEFSKMVSAIFTLPLELMPLEQKAVFTRRLFNDYYILVSKNQMTPFNMPEPTDKDFESFKKLMHTLNEILIEGNVPLKENENGELDVDVDEIRKNPEKYF